MISVVAFDADDTLWHHEIYFHRCKDELLGLLSKYMSEDEVFQSLDRTQQGNLPIFGYGVKSFTLSAIELAITASNGEVDPLELRRILELGKGLMAHPIEPLPLVVEVLEVLSQKYTLALITKGDLFHQERKIEASGLGTFFSSVNVVSDKTVETYETIVQKLGVPANEFLMVGNSLRSDILPVVKMGSHAIYIPSEYEWSHESVAPEFLTDVHFHQVEGIGECVGIIDNLNEQEPLSAY